MIQVVATNAFMLNKHQTENEMICFLDGLENHIKTKSVEKIIKNDHGNLVSTESSAERLEIQPKTNEEEPSLRKPGVCCVLVMTLHMLVPHRQALDFFQLDENLQHMQTLTENQ